MENKTLSEMKGSEIHRIVASVLEIMEKAGFSPQVDVKLQEPEEGTWKMDFAKNNSNLDEMNNIKSELGINFNIDVYPKDAKHVLISIVAPSLDFITLIGK